MEIRKMALQDLHPAEYNPRKPLRPGHPEYEKLKRSIEEYGCVQLIVWNQRTGNVVGGHQTLTVLRDIGTLEADVCVVDLSEADEKALNIALNKISGEWDYEALNSLLQELQGEVDVTITGFTEVEIDQMMADVPVGGGMINDLLEEEFVSKQPEANCFQITIVFPIEVRDMVEAFIKDRGKGELVDAILDYIRADAAAGGGEGA